jgi:membrane-associated phospholipid phosphatase
VEAQDALLAQYRAVRGLGASGTEILIQPVYGVAAMPSLHVAAQAFLALWAARSSRRLSIGLWILTAITFWGSLVTGWHYAVDGYVGLALAFVVVWLCGRTTVGAVIGKPAKA